MKELITKLMEDNPGYIMLAGFIILIGAIGKARLFAKANQPMLAALVPIWDMFVVLKMVGRPSSHFVYFLIPVYNIYFSFKVLIEIAQSFGKYTMTDAFFACFFNVFYVLNLGLAYQENYYGPVYGISLKDVQARKPVLV
jgi:hypothetical protein